MWWECIFLFSLHVHNLEPWRKELSSLALMRWFCWDNRVAIVLTLPFLPTPFPCYFWSSQNPLLVSIHGPGFLFFLFSHTFSPAPKAFFFIDLTASSEFKKHQQHTLSWDLEGLCCYLLFLPFSSIKHPSSLKPLLLFLHPLCLMTPRSPLTCYDAVKGTFCFGTMY